MSGGAKNAIGLLRRRQLDITLCFFGAGGHVSIFGIRNLCAFGVEQLVPEIFSPPNSESLVVLPTLGELSEQIIEDDEVELSWFFTCRDLFSQWVLLGFVVDLLVLALLLPFDAIGQEQNLLR